MTEVLLSELADAAGCRAGERRFGLESRSRGVTADSRSVTAGCLFVCMPSGSRDTHSFLPEVKRAGAGAALVHSGPGLRYAESLGLPAFLVEPSGSRFNFALGRVCRLATGDPTARLRIFGVTGTNGKTTTAWMVRNALLALGRGAAYLGTLGFQSGNVMEALNNTTPFPVELWNRLAQAEGEGVTDVVMEASSHALLERRLAGVQFDVGVFTNLSQEHLDYHGTMEAYAAAKKLLFTEMAGASGKPFVGALNVGDARGAEWARDVPCRVLSFGTVDADLDLAADRVGVDSIDFRVRLQETAVAGRLGMGGLFNVENAASALAGLVALGHGLEESVRALESVGPVPGRFESVANGAGVGVIVDYAHTPDGLEVLLRSARALDVGRVITVFGCGGDRDRSKRPLMGAVASRLSDVVVVTSDNPRTEDPSAIIADVMAGVPAGVRVKQIVDRREAVRAAVMEAEKGDLVVIAGKGHEDYQIIGRTKTPMDDRDLARDALGARS